MTGFLDKSEFEAYQGGQDASLRLTAALWAFVVLVFAGMRLALASGSAWVFVPAGVLAFLAIGWAQASLSNGFHEAVHYNFGRRHRDALALALLGYPTFFTLNYRTVHMQHHRAVGDPREDPDFATFSPFPRTRGELLHRLLYMGSGIAAAKQLLTRNLKRTPGLARSKRKGRGGHARELAGLAIVQVAILGLVWGILGSPLYYLLFWILPLGTVGKLAKSTRAFCEHGSPDRAFVLRTITGTPLQTGTLGMYGFHYHGEHHLYPWVPWARLGALHRQHLRALEQDARYRAEHDPAFEVFEGGYFRLLWKWFRELSWQRPGEVASVLE